MGGFEKTLCYEDRGLGRVSSLCPECYFQRHLGLQEWIAGSSRVCSGSEENSGVYPQLVGEDARVETETEIEEFNNRRVLLGEDVQR
jgi:hypothetical protein